MLTRDKAELTLHNSFESLNRKKGTLTLQDIEAETINIACLLIIKHYRSEIISVHDVNQIGSYIERNMRFIDKAKFFTNYTSQVFPLAYTSQHAHSANIMIIQNITWAGMWDFLREYFLKTHGTRIDDVSTEATIFDSNRHKRYENGTCISTSSEKRKVIVNFRENKNKAVISIEPSLSAKTARLSRRDGDRYIYIGEDPDYQFNIKLDTFDEITAFSLEMPTRSLKIDYYV